jgi:peptidoglycan/LPS O-acetylase OafA/YrhL
MQGSKYRPEIDGLRAIAVVPVILFHYNLHSVAPGGFVGVDVFFVISGYLITRVIRDEVEAGSFSVAEFYFRRVRRIFPALIAMYLACCVASLIISFPSEAGNIGTSIVASIFFVSNIVFYNSSGGYFDQKMESNPLLHTWSLSVEEQFYLFFPIAVYLLRHRQQFLKLYLLPGIALFSFVASALAVQSNPDAAFYLLQYRAWELLFGSVLAMGVFPAVKRKIVAEGAGLAGLLLILGSMLFLSEQTPFPGLAALPSCLGAVLIIHATTDRRTLLSDSLSIYPLRFIGLISYSLYLWHWPIIVFYRFIREPSSIYEKAFLIFLCGIVAFASWKYIETPFRRSTFSLSRRSYLSSAAGVMAAAAIFALALGALNSSVWRVPHAIESVLSYVDYDASRIYRMGSCFLTSEANDIKMFRPDECLVKSPDKSDYLVMGDSHAAHLWPGLNAAFSDINFLQATASGCRPLLAARGERRCTQLMHQVFDEFLQRETVDGVFLSARWQASELPSIINTVNELRRRGLRVVVFGPILEYDQALPRILARSVYSGDVLLPNKLRNEIRKDVDTALSSSLRSVNIEYVSIHEMLCRDGCIIWAGENVPLQFDYGHLTEAGSLLLAKKLDRAFFR